MTEEQKQEAIKNLWDELIGLNNDITLIHAEGVRLKKLSNQKMQRMLEIQRELEKVMGIRGKG